LEIVAKNIGIVAKNIGIVAKKMGIVAKKQSDVVLLCLEYMDHCNDNNNKDI
jgi:hypothetical protein